jgi:FO synthase
MSEADNTSLTADLLALADVDLIAAGGQARRSAGSPALTYSRKVFIPLTQLCRDVCHYCTFAKAPRNAVAPFMTPAEVLRVAQAGAAAGCKEALFTLGDKPELRYRAAREALDELGYATTVDYLAASAAQVLERTGLLPHINAGVLTADDYTRLRPVSASMGLMLESTSRRLMKKGGAHHGSPDKDPAVRLESIAEAGRQSIPFTTGILIGIGETRAERLEALIAIRDLHRTFGHIQEVIVQNFRAKPGTRMRDAAEPPSTELLWSVAAARLILGPDIGVQAPPNLNPGQATGLIGAGLSDWGGISPVTIDHVNPEAPWPDIETLAAECAEAGFPLVERLTLYPAFAVQPSRWLDAAVQPAVLKSSEADGYARAEQWSPGQDASPPGTVERPLGTRTPAGFVRRETDTALAAAVRGDSLAPGAIAALLTARGEEAAEIVATADHLRREVSGDAVTYVVNRNINYTNICIYSCSFCAFSKTSARGGLRDKPYVLSAEEISSRVSEAWDRGATEVCLQGGIHPSYTGQTYVDVIRAVKRARPEMHVHAFSPLEITHGASSLGIPVIEFLKMLQAEGLGSLPGTAAEILDDEVRATICPDKVDSAEWLDVIGAAHAIGLSTTATIMFGHMERPIHQARHLCRIRELQLRSGGFTEFVPLPFVHMQSPIFLRGGARRGPSWRETVLMHAVSRIALHRAIGSIQVSWVKLGHDGAAACLSAGCNDLGGVLMNESISRAAGAAHGQEMDVDMLAAIAGQSNRPLVQRTTLYGLAESSMPN